MTQLDIFAVAARRQRVETALPTGLTPEAASVGRLLADRHRGISRAAVERELNDELEQLGLRLAPASLRAAIHELRLAGVLVGSHPQNGYWLIENDDERKLTLRQLTSRIRHQAAAVRALDRAFGDRLQAVLDFQGES